MAVAAAKTITLNAVAVAAVAKVDVAIAEEAVAVGVAPKGKTSRSLAKEMIHYFIFSLVNLSCDRAAMVEDLKW